METAFLWISEAAFLIGGILYLNTMERRDYFWQRLLGWSVVFCLFSLCANPFLAELAMTERIVLRGVGYVLLIVSGHSCWNISWSVAMYQSIWAFMSWQLLFEVWTECWQIGEKFLLQNRFYAWGSMLMVFVIGYLIAAFTIAKWMPDGGPKKIGPRQLVSALLIFGTFEIIALTLGTMQQDAQRGATLYLSQLLLALILYLQNELFKKSAIRQERFASMNLL